MKKGASWTYDTPSLYYNKVEEDLYSSSIKSRISLIS